MTEDNIIGKLTGLILKKKVLLQRKEDKLPFWDFSRFLGLFQNSWNDFPIQAELSTTNHLVKNACPWKFAFLVFTYSYSCRDQLGCWWRDWCLLVSKPLNLRLEFMNEKSECLEILYEYTVWDGNIDLLFFILTPQYGTRSPVWDLDKDLDILETVLCTCWHFV